MIFLFVFGKKAYKFQFFNQQIIKIVKLHVVGSVLLDPGL